MEVRDAGEGLAVGARHRVRIAIPSRPMKK
jgi:hypothetical protein